MKALKLLVLAVVGIVIVFFGIGVFVPSIEVEVSVDVDRSADRTWAVFTDVERMGEWLHGFEGIETVRGSHGEVGSIYRLTFVENGQSIVFTETVTAWEEPARFAFTMDNPMMTQEVDVRLEPRGEGCTIVHRGTVRGNGAVWRSLLALMKPTITGRTRQGYESLKAIVEAEG